MVFELLKQAVISILDGSQVFVYLWYLQLVVTLNPSEYQGLAVLK